MLNGAKYTSIVVIKLVLYYKIGCRYLYYVHFLIQVFNLSSTISYRFVKEGSIGYDIAVRGEVASD